MRIAVTLLFISLGMRLHAQEYRFELAAEQSGASCTAYTVVDGKGKPVTLPQRVRDFLQCPAYLSIYKGILTYTDGDTVKNCRLQTGAEQALFVMPDSVDGVSGPAWGPGADRLMFVIINQEKRHGYTESCRIIHLQLRPNGTVKQKLKYDRPVHFSCGSICTAEAGKDFMYLKNGRIIRYKIRQASGGRTYYGQVAVPG
jgi:hypothetical protein